MGVLRDLVFQIPAGRVSTFRALAEALGDPDCAPFVASSLMSELAKDWPVHRIVHSSGGVGRVFGEEQGQTVEKLRQEGVRIVGDRVSPLLAFFFADFQSPRPLARLQEEQKAVARKVCLSPLAEVRHLGAVDVAYRADEAIASFVWTDAQGEPLDFLVVSGPARFPYIRTYLSYRELPTYLAVLREAKGKGLWPDVLLVDGNGILHPRRAGVATHLGVLLDLPTVGVAKGHLCGDVNTEGMVVGEWRPVFLDREMVAAALRTGRNRTLFISPGHRADVQTAVQLISALPTKRDLPLPLQFAHEIATEAARA